MIDFLVKQIKDIKTGGKEVFLRKNTIFFKKTWYIISHFPFYVLAIPLVLILRLIKPFILIRIGGLISSRIGHFAGNIELYLCEKDAGINTPKQKYIDLFYFQYKPICNHQLARMWKRILYIGPELLLAPIRKVNKLLPSWEVHEIGQNTQHDRDVHNLLDQYPHHLEFTDQEKNSGIKGLRELGIPEKASFVCLFVRDSAYLNTQFGSGYSYHDYRDCDIQNYVLAAEELANLGYYVIRMGAAVNQLLKSDHPKIIDYAGKGLRTDFMDIYLGYKCEFCISSSAGWDSVPSCLFRKPTIFTNVVPIGLLLTFSSKFLLTTRRYIDSKLHRELTLAEIFDTGVGFFSRASQYKNAGITLIENTPQEIKDVVTEMVELIKYPRYIHNEEDENLQKCFWEIFPVHSKDSTFGNAFHGEIKARFSSAYLRNNRHWLS